MSEREVLYIIIVSRFFLVRYGHLHPHHTSCQGWTVWSLSPILSLSLVFTPHDGSHSRRNVGDSRYIAPHSNRPCPILLNIAAVVVVMPATTTTTTTTASPQSSSPASDHNPALTCPPGSTATPPSCATTSTAKSFDHRPARQRDRDTAMPPQPYRHAREERPPSSIRVRVRFRFSRPILRRRRRRGPRRRLVASTGLLVKVGISLQHIQQQ